MTEFATVSDLQLSASDLQAKRTGCLGATLRIPLFNFPCLEMRGRCGIELVNRFVSINDG
jgi:hypothetical protein